MVTQLLVARGMPKATQAAARYTPAGGRERCGGCRHFMAPSVCNRILGPVTAAGWCRYFSQRPPQRAANFPGLVPTGPPGASLNLSFMQPGTLPPVLTFTRGSTATYFDATGTMQTAATNAPRWDYNPATHVLQGLLLEEARTNLLLNSATLGTQGAAVTAQAYTLSFYGTGTITKSGAATGALVGTGAFPQRVTQTFTPSAGTLTCTVTGSVLSAQLEAGTFATSYIATTGATAARALDSCTIPSANMGFFTSPGGSWFAEFINFNPTMAGKNLRIIGQATAGGITPLFEDSTSALLQYDGATVATANLVTANAVTKGASTWASGAAKMCLNAGAVATSAALTSGYPMASFGVGLMCSSAFTVGDSMSGYLQAVSYWPRILSNAEMQSVTT